MKNITGLLVAVSLAGLCALPANAAVIYDAGLDLRANEASVFAGSNPNVVVPEWSYGYRAGTTGVMTPFTFPLDHTVQADRAGYTDHFGSPCCGNLPALLVNTSGSAFGDPQGTVNPGHILVHPDGDPGGNFASEQKVVIQFTASIAGSYSVAAFFEDLNDCCGTNNNPSPGVDVHVVRNGVSLFDDAISREAGGIDPLNLPTSTSYSNPSLALAIGDKVEFVVGTNGQLYGDSTLVDASLTLVPEPASFVLFGLSAMGLCVTARRRKA